MSRTPGGVQKVCAKKVRAHFSFPRLAIISLQTECLQHPSIVIKSPQTCSPYCFKMWPLLSSGEKKEPKPKLFGPDIFRSGGGLPRERVGAKKLGMSLETQGNQTFGRDIPGFCRDI